MALDVDEFVSIHHHLLHRRIGEQLLERAESDRLAQDQLAEAVPRGPLEDGDVFVHHATHDLRQRPQRSRPRRSLGPPALDQAAP